MINTEQLPNQVKAETPQKISRPGKLAYVLMLAGAIVLSFTGIGTFLFGPPPMTHWVLMAHVAAAPLFAIGLALVALAWSGASRFGTAPAGSAGVSPASSGQSGLAKTLLWLILLGGLVVLLTGVLPMTPLFGTSGQHLLYLTHRYSAMVVAGALCLHVIALLRNRP